MFKRYVLPVLATVAVVTALVAVAVLSNDTEDKQHPKPPRVSESPIEQQYLTTVFQLVPEFQDDRESDVIAVGQTVCERMDEGKSVGYIVRRMPMIPKPEAKTLVAVSVKAFCPEHIKAVEGR